MKYRGINYNPNIRGHWLTKQAIDMTERVREHDELEEVVADAGFERTVRHDTSIYSRFDRMFTYRERKNSG